MINEIIACVAIGAGIAISNTVGWVFCSFYMLKKFRNSEL